MKKNELILKQIQGKYAVCKLEAKALIPNWISENHFNTISRTDDELSVVCLDENIPVEVDAEKEWKILKIEGMLDFSLVGIIAKISSLLAEASISIFVISTFNTDYILIKENKLKESVNILSNHGYTIK